LNPQKNTEITDVANRWQIKERAVLSSHADLA